MFDVQLWKQMLLKFNYFWSKYIAPEILAGNQDNNPISKDLKSRPIATLCKNPVTAGDS